MFRSQVSLHTNYYIYHPESLNEGDGQFLNLTYKYNKYLQLALCGLQSQLQPLAEPLATSQGPQLRKANLVCMQSGLVHLQVSLWSELAK